MKSRRRIFRARSVHSARVLICYCVLQALTAVRVATADSGNVEDILPLANDPNDPIGVERDPGFDRAAALNTRQTPSAASNTPEDRARYGPTPPPFAAKSGEALTAVASVRELHHRLSLELVAGLALLEAELEFENSADKPAEVEYRLAVPEDAALAGLEACNARGCRTGILAPATERGAAYDDAVRARGPKPLAQQLPLAHAYKARDARGPALIVRAAAVERDLPLTVRVRYATAAPVHGGVARLRLPPRGMDPRAAPLELSLKASDLASVQAGVQTLAAGAPPLRSDPWQPIDVRASQAGAGARAVWQFPCGSQQCSRAYASAPPRTAAAADLILAVDASPSTEGVARSRMLQAIAAILARAPQGTRVRALRFASRVEPLIAERKDPGQLALSAFGSVSYEAELGSATRFEAAWEVIRGWGFSKSNPLVVIVGDGGITRGQAKPFDAARRAGVEVSVVNVADRATIPALSDGAQVTGGTVIDAGAEADEAARGGSADRLEERLAALFAPVAIARPILSGLSAGTRKLPALRAGESMTIEGVSRSTWTLQASASTRASAPPARLLLAMSMRGQERNHTATGGVLDAPSAALLAVDARDLGRGGRDRPDTAAGSKDCDRRGPASRHGGLSSDAKPVALAAERTTCASAAKKPLKKQEPEDDGSSQEIGSGMPSSPLLGMLRQRIIPVARGCFRKDRAGRADYQVRAVFAFELAEREVVSAEVTGKITEALRECLLTAIDGLSVPRFSGRVVVHYPLVTEREALPSQIELTPEAAEKVDSLLAP
jgi:VWA domain containing CoxE-like protein